MCDHPNREAAMVVLASDDDGKPTVWCDPCIAPLVKTLNDAGLHTVWSCCGHGRRPAQIGLRDGREVVILANASEANRIEGLWPDINAPEPTFLQRFEAWVFDADPAWRGFSRLMLSMAVVVAGCGGLVGLLMALGSRHPALAIIPVTVAAARWVRWTLR